MRGQVCLDMVNPAREALRDWKTIARIADRALQAARQRQPTIGGMRFAPARDRPRCRQRGRQNAAKRNFAVAMLLEPIDAATRSRPPPAVQIAHLPRLGIVNEPECVATDPGHVRVQDRERSAGRDCRIHGRAASAQDIDARLRSQRVGTGNHPLRSHGHGTASRDLQSSSPSNGRSELDSILNRKQAGNPTRRVELRRCG